MARKPAGEQIFEIKPTNNIYTVLVIVAVVVQIAAAVVLVMRNNTLFTTPLWK
jgi:hypothetical protein